MKFLFLFLDGVGLGPDDPKKNPFAKFDLPHLEGLLNRHCLVQNNHTVISTPRATLIPLDACLGVTGRPQSASG